MRILVGVMVLVVSAQAHAEPIHATPYAEFVMGAGTMSVEDQGAKVPLTIGTVRVGTGIVVRLDPMHLRLGVTGEILGVAENGLASGLEAEVDGFVTPTTRLGVRAAASHSQSLPDLGIEQTAEGLILSLGVRVRIAGLGCGVDLLRLRGDRVSGSGMMVVGNLGDLTEVPAVVRAIAIGVTAFAAIALSQHAED